MSDRGVLRRAVDLLTEFGIDGTGWTVEELRELADGRCSFTVRWYPMGQDRGQVVLHLSQPSDRVIATIRPEMGALRTGDVRIMFDFAQRVLALAERIESLR